MTDSNTNTASRTSTKAVGAIATLAAASFLLGALLHAGVEVPLGVATLAEPEILPAVIVEGICAVVLSIGAYGLLAGRRWGPRAARAASVVAVGGVLIGTTALALGAGPRTQFNDLLHVVMLVLLLMALGLLPSQKVEAQRTDLPRRGLSAG